jgi:hypothetical protein
LPNLVQIGQVADRFSGKSSRLRAFLTVSRENGQVRPQRRRYFPSTVKLPAVPIELGPVLDRYSEKSSRPRPFLPETARHGLANNFAVLDRSDYALS